MRSGSRQAWELTLAEAADLIRTRALSPVEVGSSVISRMEQTEDPVHAYAYVTADSARSAAQQAEKDILRGLWRGPLHGIPIGLKDLLSTAGVPTEAGSRV